MCYRTYSTSFCPGLGQKGLWSLQYVLLGALSGSLMSDIKPPSSHPCLLEGKFFCFSAISPLFSWHMSPTILGLVTIFSILISPFGSLIPNPACTSKYLLYINFAPEMYNLNSQNLSLKDPHASGTGRDSGRENVFFFFFFFYHSWFSWYPDMPDQKMRNDSHW